MRKYKNTEACRLEELYCNQCGKRIPLEKDRILEGVFHGEVHWGYFSKKDGETDSFDLCEECYDKWIAGFALPVEKKVEHEFL